FLVTLAPRSTLFPYTTLFRSQYVGGRLSMKQMASGNYLIGGGWPSRMIVQHGQVRKDLRPRLNLESMRGNLSLAVRFWPELADLDRKSTRLNSSHVKISYAVF